MGLPDLARTSNGTRLVLSTDLGHMLVFLCDGNVFNHNALPDDFSNYITNSTKKTSVANGSATYTTSFYVLQPWGAWLSKSGLRGAKF